MDYNLIPISNYSNLINNTNITNSDEELSITTKSVLTSFYVLIIFLGFIGNALVCSVLVNNLKLPCFKNRSKVKRQPISVIYSTKRRTSSPNNALSHNPFLYDQNNSRSIRVVQDGLTIYQPKSCAKCQEVCRENGSKKHRIVYQNAKKLACSSLAESSSIKSLLLFNLSIADLMMSILALSNLLYDIHHIKVFSVEFICRGANYAQGTNVMVSAFTHVAISIDRFIIIFYPLRPRMSYKSVVLVIISVWIATATLMAPTMLVNEVDATGDCAENWIRWDPRFSQEGNVSLDSPEWKNYNTNMRDFFTMLYIFLQYALPLVVICVTYTAIILKMKLRHTPGEFAASRQHQMARAESKVIKMFIVVALCYGISQLPRHVIYFLSKFFEPDDPYKYQLRILWIFASLIALSSVSYNPIIYAWMNIAFRKYCVSKFCDKTPYCCWNKQSTIQTSKMTDSEATIYSGIKRQEHTCQVISP